MTSTELLLEALPPAAFPARWVELEREGYRLGYRVWSGQEWRCVFVRRREPVAAQPRGGTR